jgi:proton glutamate symport protein
MSEPQQKGARRFLDSLGKWMLSAPAALIGMVLGCLIGIYAKGVVPYLAPYGEIYLWILQMCILPILLSAVASSLGTIVKSRESRAYLKRMLLALAAMVLLVSCVGTLVGLVGRPGAGLDQETKRRMGTQVLMASRDGDGGGAKSKYAVGMEMNFYTPEKQAEKPSRVRSFFEQVIPPNVFAALAQSRNLQVLFFAIILGIAAGSLKAESAGSLLGFLNGLYQAFTKVIRWAMYLLPVGLVCLLADQVSKMGGTVLLTMTKFIVMFYIAAALMFVVNTVVIWKRSGGSPLAAIARLKEPIIIALGTRNSLATLPSAINAVHERLGFEKTGTQLILPLATLIGRFGNVLYFALAAVFVAQLYEAPLGLYGMLFAVVGAILAGMATSGSTGILTLAMITIVLEPMGLPVEAALVLLMAIDPICDPARTLTIVHTSCAVTTLATNAGPGAQPEPSAAGTGPTAEMAGAGD